MIVNAQLFSFVVVADENKYEDKSQWNNNPKRIDTVRLVVVGTIWHGCLQSEGGIKKKLREPRGFLRKRSAWVGDMISFSVKICMRDTKRPKTLDETCIRRQT